MKVEGINAIPQKAYCASLVAKNLESFCRVNHVPLFYWLFVLWAHTGTPSYDSVGVRLLISGLTTSAIFIM